MQNNNYELKDNIFCNNEGEIIRLLNSGVDPNLEGGWPIRLAARQGAYSIVKTLIQYGANPHLLAESGASTLQLAVFSGKHWDTDNWMFLLSCCDSSQLADGAAVAIVFSNIPALKKILDTGRCNAHIPTTLTGKTVEQLAKGYKLHELLNPSENTVLNQDNIIPSASPRNQRQNRPSTRSTLTPSQPSQRNLSPSVARFFQQTASQSSLSPTRSPVIAVATSSLAEPSSLQPIHTIFNH